MLRCDCGSPSCVHPKPTLYDWYSLAFCYYPRTVTVLEFVAKGVLLMLAVLIGWLFIFVLFSLNAGDTLGRPDQTKPSTSFNILCDYLVYKI